MKALTLIFTLLFACSVFAGTCPSSRIPGTDQKKVDGKAVKMSAAESTACIEAAQDKDGCGDELKGCTCIKQDLNNKDIKGKGDGKAKGAVGRGT